MTELRPPSPAPALQPLHKWAAAAGVRPDTARKWARTGVLDGGPDAARVGAPGVLAVRDGAYWYVVRAPQRKPEAEPQRWAEAEAWPEGHAVRLAALEARVERIERALRSAVEESA